MSPPSLKLSFVQGPRDGDSLEYQHGSTVRIGRIVRGNDIAIKDSGISTKHLQIVSDSDNWIIRDLGSSNGTILNSDTLEPDTAFNLRHGDVIKLGEYTSIVVNFVTGIEAQEHKLPPRAKRNNRRMNVADPGPDPVPIELVQEKPRRKGRSKKQDNASSKEDEPPKRTRASRSRTLEDISDSRKKEKKVEITKEEDPEEKKETSESVQNLGMKSIKMEVEDTPKEVKMAAMTRASRITRGTRSKKNIICGDSFEELEMVLNKARKNRAKSKKKETECRNDEVEEEEEKENEAKSERSDKEDETSKKRVEIEFSKKKRTLGEEDTNCTVGEEGETIGEESDCKKEEMKTADEEKVKEGWKNKRLEEMTVGEWFDYMEVQLRKQIIEETEKIIEPMRSKAMRVHKYIQEQKQKQPKEKGSLN